MLLSNGAKIGDEKHDVMVNCLLKGEFNAIDVTSEFLSPVGNKEPKIENKNLNILEDKRDYL